MQSDTHGNTPNRSRVLLKLELLLFWSNLHVTWKHNVMSSQNEKKRVWRYLFPSTC